MINVDYNVVGASISDYSFGEVLWAMIVGLIMLGVFTVSYPFFYFDSLIWTTFLTPVLIFVEPILIAWALIGPESL